MPARCNLLIAALLLTTACSGGDDKNDVARTSAPLPTLPTATATTPAPSPTATSPSPTPKGRAKPAIDGDVDGDGTADSIRSTATTLSVELSATGKTVTTAVHGEGPGDAGLLGSKDVDRDGFAEVFLETAHGASTTFATPYRFDGTTLHELQLDGGPVRLGIGGTVTHGDGFRCLPSGRLEVRSADSQDGDAFTVHVDTYRLGASELVLLSSTTSPGKQGDPSVEQSYVVSCGTVGDGA
jgi:hypothetical protein